MNHLRTLTILALAAAVRTQNAQVPAASTPTPSPAAQPAPSPKIYVTPPLAAAPIPASDLASIRAALPADATARPKQPRRLLIFWRAEGFVHPSIPYGVEALKELGEKTGAYTSVSSDDMAMFDPGTLAQFDAVAFVNTTQLKFDNPVHRKALLDFVAGGKGVVGIHAASDNFPTWPEGQALMGGVFHGHPWHGSDLVAVKLDDPAHPINAGFANQGFRLQEEIYQITGPYGRDKVRELVSLDMSKPENQRNGVLDKAGKPVVVRTDNDFPISWIKKEGNGRVFYTSLGHNKDIYFVPRILRHYLDGIQYALGDLTADDLPTASLQVKPVPALAPEGSRETLQKVKAAPEPPKTPTNAASAVKPSQIASEPLPVQAAGESALRDLSTYRYGDMAEAPFNVLESLRNGTAESRARLEPKLVAILKDSSATDASKQTVCRWLAWMGGEDAVPELSKLGASASGKSANAAGVTGSFALSALATIPVASADQALLNLLMSGNEDRRVAVMSAIGIRGTKAAIPELSKIAAMKSPVLSGAAFRTLAALRGADALNAILGVKAAAANVGAKDTAIIDAASGLLKGTGESLPDRAVAALDSITGSDAPPVERLSALRVLLSAQLPAGYEKAVKLLGDADYRLRLGAAESLARTVSPGKLAGIPWSRTPDAWVVLLKTLAQQGDSSSLPLFMNALGSQDESVRIAALEGVSRAGDAGVISTVTPLLTDSNAPVALAARNALAGIKGEDVSPRLMVLEGNSQPAAASVLLAVLADRQEHKAIDAAIAAMKSPEPMLQAAGCEALSRLATSGDLGQCLSLLPVVKERNAENFQKALVRAAVADPSPAAAATQIVAAFDQGDESRKEILINVLARLEVKEADDKLAAILASQDIAQRKQAIRALASARSEASLTLLPAVAASGQTNSEKILALKGFIDTIDTLPNSEMNRRVEGYGKAWKLAVRDEEKAAIRDAVKRIPAKKMPSTAEAKQLLLDISASATPAPSPTQP